MNKTNIIAIVLAMVLLTVFFSFYDEDNTVVLYSSTGCCSISVTTTQVEYDTIYTIVYTNNQTGEVHTEVETTKVDADYMVNLLQEDCYTHHTK